MKRAFAIAVLTSLAVLTSGCGNLAENKTAEQTEKLVRAVNELNHTLQNQNVQLMRIADKLEDKK